MSRRALDDLVFIRATMESSALHTAIPGWGGVTMGLTALVATPFALTSQSSGPWFGVWMIAAVIGTSVGALEMWRKARSEGVSLVSGPGSRFAKALAPALIAGALLTLAIHATGPTELLPGVWLLCYGAAVVAAGAHSLRTVRTMGLSIMLVGAVALLGLVFAREERWLGDLCMAAGFGVMHVVFGLKIAGERRG
ncbi:MAG: hypothetical protein SGI72_11225 [Planctomycetota bacterium]|nr:hypothetical protein [Planctomycetota bacterium]